MAQIQRQRVEVQAKNCSADKVYGFVKDTMTKLPPILPQTHKSVQILAGDGKSVGSVRLWKFLLGNSGVPMTVKEKIRAVDDESRTITFGIIDGDVMPLYKTFEFTMSATPIMGDDQSCLVTCTLEYEKQNDDVPAPNEYMEFTNYVTKGIVNHLLIRKA
ncbi:hypothetical protein MKW94_008803 [Papaver nudicaule]|uniref:Bet v I/Major latex protein domain-containing protein n=1 Tax=Papaver nudicaule TaxID=74823 RepID=A0AA41UUG4_PAPNU|nr:hypothetical protein [Papaver nudicaule]